MPRIRTIKPEFWHDEKLASISRDARLLFIGLWNLSDDYGTVRSNPVWIKSQLFPYEDTLRVSLISEWIGHLVKARMLEPFTYNGENFYNIRTFKSHQIINKPSKPIVPEKEKVNLLTQYYSSSVVALPEYSQQEGKGKEEERKGESNAHEGDDEDQPTTVLELEKLLFAQEKWVSDIKLTHRGKNLKQAIRESWNHPAPARKKTMDLHDWKRLVNTWLANSKPGNDDVPEVKLGTNNQHILDQLPYEFNP